MPRLLLSVDRSGTLADAMDVVALARDLRAHSRWAPACFSLEILIAYILIVGTSLGTLHITVPSHRPLKLQT
jgi:hypothetical protein